MFGVISERWRRTKELAAVASVLQAENEHLRARVQQLEARLWVLRDLAIEHANDITLEGTQS